MKVNDAKQSFFACNSVANSPKCTNSSTGMTAMPQTADFLVFFVNINAILHNSEHKDVRIRWVSCEIEV